MFNTKFKLTSLALASSLLVACGGGGGDSTGGSTPPPYNGKQVNGVAVDFYLAGATVQFNDCKDSNNKPLTVKTNAQGTFNFTTTENCKSSSLTITGGVDTVTEKEFTGTLKIKSTDLENGNKIAVTPLTTLQSILTDTEFNTVLTKLGFTAAQVNIDPLDPENNVSAKQLATIFLVQQLLTQIEDAIEQGGSPTTNATDAAAQALSTVLQNPNNSLITDSGFDASVLELIVDQALIPQGIDTTTISTNITAISNAVATIGLDGNASALVDALNNDTTALSNIQNAIPNPPAAIPTKSEFTTLKIGNYSLLKFQQTTQDKPLQLTKSQFEDITKVELKLTLPDTSKPAIAKIGLQVNAGQSTNASNKYLYLVLDSVDVYFNSLGEPIRAVLPKDKSIKVDSNVNALNKYKNTTIKANQDIPLTINNGVVDLGSFAQDELKLKTVFNSYYDEIVNIGTAKVETTINMTNYSASDNLAIPVLANKTILTTSFTNAYNVTGYFKFKPEISIP